MCQSSRTLGDHFSSAFWFPAIPASIHFDTFASCGLYGLALRELAPFIRACSGQDSMLVRKDESNGIPHQPAYSNVCGFTAVRFLMKALDELKGDANADSSSDGKDAGKDNDRDK